MASEDGVHVVDARRGLVGAQQNIVEIGMPVARPRDRIDRHFAQVAGGDQIVERLRRRCLSSVYCWMALRIVADPA